MPGCQKKFIRPSKLASGHLLQLTQQNTVKYKRMMQCATAMYKTETIDTEYTSQSGKSATI